MTNRNSLRKSVFKGKYVMRDEHNYLDTDIYNEFIQHQSYVDETQNNLPFIIFELTSTNPMESQSQNISVILRFSMTVMIKTRKRRAKTDLLRFT